MGLVAAVCFLLACQQPSPPSSSLLFGEGILFRLQPPQGAGIVPDLSKERPALAIVRELEKQIGWQITVRAYARGLERRSEEKAVTAALTEIRKETGSEAPKLGPPDWRTLDDRKVSVFELSGPNGQVVRQVAFIVTSKAVIGLDYASPRHEDFAAEFNPLRRLCESFGFVTDKINQPKPTTKPKGKKKGG